MNNLPNTDSERFFGKPFSADRLFCDLSPKTQKSLRRIMHLREFRKKQLIYDVGEFPCSIYVFVEGQARLFLNSKSGKKLTIRSIHQDEILGLTEALAYFQYETGVETITQCTCQQIDRQELLDLLENDSKVCFRLFKLLGADLHQSYKLFSSSTLFLSPMI